MKKDLFSRFELLFWNFAIRILSSFRMMRSSLARADQLAYSTDSIQLWALVAVAGVTGLVSGYLFYFISNGLR